MQASAMSSRTGSRADDSASGTRGESEDITWMTEPPYLEGDETCSATSEVVEAYPNCRRSRSCRSCLQKSGCMINQYGKCVNQVSGAYSTWTDFRQAYSQGLVLPNATMTQPSSAYTSQLWLFPAFEASYCPTSDKVCQKCIANRFWSPSTRPDSRFCEGENGCLCIFDCEDNWYVPAVDCSALTSTTPTPTVSTVMDLSGFDSMVKIMGVGLGVLLIIFAACLLRCVRKDYDRRQHQDRARRAQREARAEQRDQQRRQRLEKLGVSALSLSGWQTFRENLIAKEKARLGRSSSDVEVTMNSTPYVLTVDEEEERTTGEAPSTEPTSRHPAAPVDRNGTQPRTSVQ